MEKGQKSWFGIIIKYMCIYTNCLNETKKGGETSKSNLKRRNIGIANMHKKYRRQDRDPGWMDHILAR